MNFWPTEHTEPIEAARHFFRPFHGVSLARVRRTMWALCAITLSCTLSAADVTINVTAAAGLKFDPARFVVAPGANVTLAFENPDDMMHNLVVVRPGTRLAVVEAALALGEEGPARNFVPAMDAVLWATPVVNPGGSARLTFRAPAAEGIYPYVCTFPGHGLVMFGAMYVARAPQLPPLERDPNVPAPVVAVGPADTLTRPAVVRTFLPDCSPAAIAIGLPGGQSYCFDAVDCRLRYAWRGEFLDNSPQWLGKGEQFARVTGRIYYRPTATARLRVGDPSEPAAVKWQGYHRVDGYPKLKYTLDGAEVTESPRVSRDGRTLEITYEIAKAKGPVTFVADADGGATVTADAGKWDGRQLSLTPAEARRFVLTFAERPGIEPLAYWSMNDLVFPGRKDPPPGVVGRAFTPGGSRRAVLDSGIELGSVLHAGTLMSWVKLDTAPTGAAGTPVPEAAPVFAAGEGASAFVLASPERSPRWHHLTAVLHHGTTTLYIDGQQRSRGPTRAGNPQAKITIGSVGQQRFLEGLLDEVRIYERALPATEIAAIFEREKRQAGETEAKQ